MNTAQSPDANPQIPKPNGPDNKGPKAFAPKYFMAAGIVFLGWGAFTFITTSLASLGLIKSDSVWMLGIVALPIVYVAHREFRARGLGLKHLTPFAVILSLLLLLILIS